MYKFFMLFLIFYTGATNGDTQILRMATTTSTENSGLLHTLLPPYEKVTNTQIHVIAVGTGKALELGRRGDVDLVLVHARQAENKFVQEGYGLKRYAVMYNDFVIVGPKNDPAGINKRHNAASSFKYIASSKSIFLSRGDDSGTHKKEKEIWKEANVSNDGQWYRQVGQGMGKTLQIAGEMGAYTLVDRGTWLAYRKNSPLTLLFEGGDELKNPYGIIIVNPKRFPDVHYTSAQNFIEWLISPAQGQSIINDYRIDGEQLFHAMAE